MRFACLGISEQWLGFFRWCRARWIPIPEPKPVPTLQPPPVREPEPIIEVEPESVPPHDGARDLVGPKLLKSSIEAGAIDMDVELDNVAFEFDESIEKSNLEIVYQNNLNLKWSYL